MKLAEIAAIVRPSLENLEPAMDTSPISLPQLMLWGLGLLVALISITLVRRRERRLRQREQTYVRALQDQLAAQSVLAAIVEATDDGILGKNREGVITSWNPGAEHLFGYLTREVIGRHCSLLFPADIQHVQNWLLEQVRQGHSVKNFETYMQRKDGQKIFVALTLSPILDNAGRIIGSSETIRDISEQRHIQERLKQLYSTLQSRVDELQTILDVVPVAIAIAHDPQCNVIKLNQAGEAMLGIQPGSNASKSGGESSQLPFKIMRNGKELPPDELPMQYAVTHATPVSEFETQIVREDGNILTLYEYASPLFDEAGQVRGCVGVFVDISERKRFEHALLEADHRKDEFLAMLAHELRNPLAPIRNAVQVMKFAGLEEAELNRCRQVIDRQVSHLAHLLDDLLDVSRTLQGKVILQKQIVSSAEIVERAAETSRPLIDERHQKLIITQPSESLWLAGDRIRLSQILSNLLNNAAKYSEEGKTIQLTVVPAEDCVQFEVKDNGMGIEPNMLGSIFDLFAQADCSLAHSQGGLGLGLPLARKLAEMHGGSLVGASEGLGCGSQFTLNLPLSTKTTQESALVKPQKSESDKGSLKILIADDYPDAAETLSFWLKLQGYETRLATCGLDTLTVAEGFHPHVVLLDIGLPDIDGFEVAKRLLKNPTLKPITLVAMTGYGQEQDLRDTAAAGFDYHLLKPVESQTLLDILKTIESYYAMALGSADA